MSKREEANCREKYGSKNVRHGWAHTDTYRSWQKMHERCRLPSCRIYKHYGGRGISVCERWAKFENFLADMGERPNRKHQLDRVDPDGNYEPGNCRWALPSDGIKRTSLLFEGKMVAQWAKELGIPAQTLYSRMKKFGSIYLPEK